MRRLLLSLGLGAALLAGSASAAVAAPATDWRRAGYDAEHNGWAPNETILSTANVSNLQLQWQIGPLAWPLTPPTAVGDTVYVEGCYGRLLAISRTDGQVLWAVDVPNVVLFPTTLSVYMGELITSGQASDGSWHVVALNASTGSLRWIATLPMAMPVGLSPTYWSGRVLIGAGAGVYALSATTGKILWSTALPVDPNAQAIQTIAVSDSGIAIASTSTGILAGLNASTGKLLWVKHSINGRHYTPPAIASGIGYVANTELVAFSPSTGRILWRRLLGGDSWATPTIGAGVVVTGTVGGNLTYGFEMAYDSRTGRPKWAATMPSENLSQATVANGVLYVGTINGFVAFDARTGKTLYSTVLFDNGGKWGFLYYPIVSNGWLFVSSGDTYLRAYRAK